MKTDSSMAAVLVVVLALLSPALPAQPASTPMPPAFSLEAGPEEILARYPLGIISKNAAFAHHGKAHREFVLPNGRPAWLYDVGQREWHRTYTLVFGKDDKVIDVLYYDHGRFSRYGLTALQVQNDQSRSARPMLGPGPAGDAGEQQ